MANTIQVKRGVFASLPTLAAGEFGFSTDTKQVHIGDGAANHEVVMHKLFDAQSLLAAVSDDTPVAVTVAEQRIVGRITSGNITALTAAEVLTLIGVDSGADVTGDNAPQAHHDLHDPEDGSDALDCAAASEIVGVQAAAEGSAHEFARGDHAHQIQHGIADNHLITVDDADAADNDFAKFTAGGLEGRSYSEVMADLSGQAGADFAMNTHKITGVVDPTGDQDAATKNYVDATLSGLDLHASCKLATAAALPACTAAGSGVGKTLTADAVGVLTVDGVATVLNDRILVKDQVTGADNGIYKVTTEGTAGVAFILTRATDFDADAEVTAGAFTFIEQGTANGDEGWILTTNDVITVDTTAMVFTQFSSAAAPTTTFVGLSDTPANYSGSTLKVARVNAGETAMEFVAFAATYLDDTAGGTDAEVAKAPTSNVMYDHGVATTGVHGAGANTILHSGSTIDGGAFA